MEIKIRCLEGPLKDKEFVLKDGLGIGRTKGDILLNDNKVSSLHALVSGNAAIGFLLSDNASKNGIRSGGEKLQSIALQPGVQFYIGDSSFIVLGEEGDAFEDPEVTSAGVVGKKSPAGPTAGTSATAVAQTAALIPNMIPSRMAADVAPTNVAPVPHVMPTPEPVDKTKWNDILEKFTLKHLDDIQDQPRAIVALEPAVALTFTRGIQAETRWVLGYGPRRIGPASIDLPLFEPKMPDLTFEVVPSVEGVTFRTGHPKTVLLNGNSVSSQLLKDGDTIAFGGTRIEVELLK